MPRFGATLEYVCFRIRNRKYRRPQAPSFAVLAAWRSCANHTRSDRVRRPQLRTVANAGRRPTSTSSISIGWTARSSRLIRDESPLVVLFTDSSSSNSHYARADACSERAAGAGGEFSRLQRRNQPSPARLPLGDSAEIDGYCAACARHAAAPFTLQAFARRVVKWLGEQAVGREVIARAPSRHRDLAAAGVR